MKNIVFVLTFRKWEDDLVKDMAEWLASDLPLPPGSPGGMTEYRRTLCISFFYKFYLTVLMQLRKRVLKIFIAFSIYKTSVITLILSVSQINHFHTENKEFLWLRCPEFLFGRYQEPFEIFQVCLCMVKYMYLTQ